MTSPLNKYLPIAYWVQDALLRGDSVTRVQVEKQARSLGANQSLAKELTEYGILKACRQLILDAKGLSRIEIFHRISELYSRQANISLRTSNSVLMQQYSTPVPISFIASSWVLSSDSNAEYFEPSAGNGFMTLAWDPQKTWVNELDDLRLLILKDQGFTKVTQQNASQDFDLYYRKFSGVCTNPPFGKIDSQKVDGYTIKKLEHLMAIKALDCMQNTGKAAIIIGGHTPYTEDGRIKDGADRYFLNHLYHHYNVQDVIHLDGHKLYSKQGTSFDIRLILIKGRKQDPQGYAPLRNHVDTDIINDYQVLYERVFSQTNDLEKAIAEAIELKAKLLEIKNTHD